MFFSIKYKENQEKNIKLFVVSKKNVTFANELRF